MGNKFVDTINNFFSASIGRRIGLSWSVKKPFYLFIGIFNTLFEFMFI
jgi:hypothetical protein